MNLMILVVLFALSVVMAARFSAATGNWIEERTGMDPTVYKWVVSFLSLLVVFLVFRAIVPGALY
ncbi:hypothetical protein [Aestuariirhabdus litorea]|uniref:Uncharacterized protein n=1 Tax=Aestuariirhabdus litorea TaxID=2528527 RepID=A0A3P3VPX0_9GAMM|nr:hypothetical protein [Aestuariirhabdus litorea]RRJ84822.1 hypothetical protein D0544_06945 [Aestuariirhabdus litorea]RWW98047.1 hypothetical protein DZC74_06940 [Endozoicomonadaceae bacterium GTF-13]